MKSSINLPPSWRDVRLGEIVEYGRTEKAEPQDIPNDAWLLELEDIEKETSRLLARVPYGQRKSKSTKNRFQAGDVLYGKLRPYLNKVLIADRDGYCTTEIVPIRPNQALDGRYLFYWLKHPAFLRYVSAVSHGLNMPRLGTDAASGAPLVLAPIGEQRRIVAVLDCCFGEIEACRQRLSRVPQILKRFREAVLESAVTGRLTKDWRTGHPGLLSWEGWLAQKQPKIPKDYKRLSKQAFRVVPIEHKVLKLPNTWAISTIARLYTTGALIDFADGNHGSLYPRKEDFGSTGSLFLTAQQLDERFHIDLGSCSRLRPEKARLLSKGWAEHADVLLSHNATVGRVALLEGSNEPVLLGTSLTFYRFNTEYMDPAYVKLLFASPFFQDQLRSVMKQTTRDQVPITKQASLHVICPPVQEQREIALRADALLKHADATEQRYKRVMEYAIGLTPSLLSKAFRGELVTQGPEDDPAENLLEHVRAERAEAEEFERVRRSNGADGGDSVGHSMKSDDRPTHRAMKRAPRATSRGPRARNRS